MRPELNFTEETILTYSLKASLLNIHEADSVFAAVGYESYY